MADMARCAGVMCVAPDGTVLLLRRTDSGLWNFPGGHIERGESAEEGAVRECEEETGFRPTEVEEWCRRVTETVDYTTFRAEVDKFEPALTPEHDLAEWVNPDEDAQRPLVPGVGIALLKADLDELGLAKAIKAGELVSPQRHHGVALHDMRITGTGASYRGQLDEYVWRDPSLYLNDWFLERCNGLPVILEHPDGRQLDGEEFRNRGIGSILLPYIRGDEVWGIAKIYDEVASRMMEAEKLSTSPAVVFKPMEEGSRYELPNGKHLLVEGKPSLIDHLAICEVGVWDKGAEPAGVSNQSQSSTGELKMAEKEEERRADEGSEDRKLGEKVEMLMDRLDSLHARLDAAMKSDESEEEKEEERKDSEEEEEKREDEAKDEEKGEEKEDSRKDSKKDAETEEGEEEEMKKEEKREDARREDSALHRRLQELERRIPAEIPEVDRERMVAAQQKADRVAQAFGDSAPRWQTGETLLQYRRRLAGMYKKHSPRFKDAALGAIGDEAALSMVEDMIYDDAMKAAMHPEIGNSGPLLRAIRERSDAGHTVTRYVGDCMGAWGDFHRPGRRLVRIHTKFD